MRSIQDILDAMDNRANEGAVMPKTASVKEMGTHEPLADDEQLLSTVRSLTAKTASAQGSTASAVDTLSKIAADLASSEDAALRKQAELGGAAFCDGFMARLAAYDTAVGTKTASAIDVEKIAAEAYTRGIEAGKAETEKLAEEAYRQGYEQTMQEIHKTAAEIHFAGQQSARNVLIALEQGA